MSDYQNKVLENIDIEKNGWSDTVNANIAKNRKGNFRIRITDKNGKELENAEVDFSLKNHEFKFGSTTFLAGEFKEEDEKKLYEERFAKLFNQGVLAFYWKDDEPEKGNLRFDKGSKYIYRRPPADEALEFCKRVGAEPKGHNMIWQNQEIGIPKWMPDDKNEFEKLIIERIKILADRYADKVPMWDVTNECTGFYNDKMPLNYDSTAWYYATKLFKNNHLILNDYNSFFGDSFKRQASPLYYQAQKLMAQGARVDAIGMQYHLFDNKETLLNKAQKGNMLNINHLYNVMDTYATLGTVMHVSEVTVPSYEGNAESLELQAKLVENLYKIWFSHESVRSIVWWNLADGFAFKSDARSDWDENFFGGGLLKHDLSEKPAYNVLDRLINHEWHTCGNTVTDKNGTAEIGGFYGDYNVVITLGTEKISKTVSLKKGTTQVNIEI